MDALDDLVGSVLRFEDGSLGFVPFEDSAVSRNAEGKVVLSVAMSVDNANRPVGIRCLTAEQTDDPSANANGIVSSCCGGNDE